MGGFTYEDDASLFVFTVVAGGISIYNSVETMFLVFTAFSKYNSLYFWSLLGCSLGIFLFAVGFLDLFFELYDGNSTVLRPLIVLTIGWYGMVTGFALTMYSRLSIVRADPWVIKFFRNFIIFNICFSHFPTTTFTFGANIVGDDFWVNGYATIEKIQMTFFCFQEVFLSLAYLYYIRKQAIGPQGHRFVHLAKHTFQVNIFVLILDLGMLILEYVDLYSYQIMLKVVVYSLKLKLEFYILNILTKTLHEIVGKNVMNNSKVTNSKNMVASSYITSVAPGTSGASGASVVPEGANVPERILE